MSAIKEIAREISNMYGISYNQALEDVKIFIFDLCKAHLMNMKHNSYMANLNFFVVYLITFKFKMAMEALNIRKRYDFPVGTNNIFSAFFFIILNILLVFKYNLLILFIMLTFVPSWGWQ